jgi:hypothetical protein
MEIVGTWGRDVLVKATAEECDQLAGKTISFSGNYSWDRSIVLGTKFDITAAFSQIHRNEKRKEEIDMIRKSLEGAINNLDLVQNFLTEPQPEVEAKESE